MRVLRTISATAAALALVAAMGRPAATAEEKTYDLRGPNPGKGLVRTEESQSRLKDATVVLRAGEAELKAGTVTIETDQKHESEILDVDGRNATRVRTRVLSSVTKMKG